MLIGRRWSQNRLILRTRADGTQVNVAYDADGLRIQKTLLDASSNVTSTTTYLVDTNNLTGYAQVFEERTTSGAPAVMTVKTYTYGSDLISSATSINAQPSTLNYFLYDGGGSVRELADEAGAITDRYYYDAFGLLIHRSGATDNAYLYRGEQWDKDLGLYFLRARFMSPDSGRFWTMDSYEGAAADPISLHRFLYGNGNPIRFWDPSGYVGDLSIPGLSATSATVGTLARMAIPRVILRNKRVQLELVCATVRFIGIGSEVLGFDVVDIDPKGPQHHIGTNKQRVGTFTERLSKLFAKGGMSLGDWANKLNLPGHFGPHKDRYHEHVLNTLESAVEAVANPTPRNVAVAIRDALMSIADEICDKKSKLYRTLTK